MLLARSREEAFEFVARARSAQHVPARLALSLEDIMMFAAGAVALLFSALVDVTGIVFNDANGNGVRDTGEAGIAGVAVSNQDTVVTTDASGAFRMTARGSGVVFVSTPDGYRAIGPFWRDADAAAPIAFPLARAASSGTFSFVHASDTHISAASAARTQRMRAVVD